MSCADATLLVEASVRNHLRSAGFEGSVGWLLPNPLRLTGSHVRLVAGARAVLLSESQEALVDPDAGPDVARRPRLTTAIRPLVCGFHEGTHLRCALTASDLPDPQYAHRSGRIAAEPRWTVVRLPTS